MGAHRRIQGPISLPVAARGGEERWRRAPGVRTVRSGLRTSSPPAASPAMASSTAFLHAEIPSVAAIRACTPSPGGDFPCFVASPDEVETRINLSHNPVTCSPARGFKFKFKFKFLFQCEFEALLRLI